MKLLLFFCSFLMLTLACSTPKEEYKEDLAEAQEDYQEEKEKIEKDYKKAQKEEAIDYIEESEGAEVKKDEQKVEVKED